MECRSDCGASHTPDTREELTLDWLQAVIRHSTDGCSLSGFDIDQEFKGESHLADLVRVVLNHSASSCSPSSIIIKFPNLDGPRGTATQPTQLYAKEAGIYEMLDTASNVPAPRLIGTFEGSNPSHHIVVMEDLSNGTPGDKVAGFSPDAAGSVILQLAALHASCWEADGFPELASGEQFLKGGGRRVEASWDGFIDRYRDEIADTGSSWEWYKAHMGEVAEHRRRRPSTLIHGDVHGENMIFTSDQSRPLVLIDWQTAGRGLAAHDVCYFLVGNVDTGDRLRYEGSLLASYYHHLMAGVELGDYSFQSFLLDYRAAVCHSMFRAIYGASRANDSLDDQELQHFADTLFRRVNAAVADLDPVAAMESIG